MRRKREEDTSTTSRQPQRRNETNRSTWNLRHGDNDSSCDGRRRRSFKKPLHLLSTYRPQKGERGEGEVRRTGKTEEMRRGGGRCVLVMTDEAAGPRPRSGRSQSRYFRVRRTQESTKPLV